MPAKKPVSKSTTKKSNTDQLTKTFILGGTTDGSKPEVTPEIYDEFDFSRLRALPIKKSEFMVGSQKIKNHNSKWVYTDDEDEDCLFYFFGPDQQCFSPTYRYAPNNNKDDEKEKKPKKGEIKDRKGVQIGVPMTGLATVENPSDLEAAWMRFLDGLRRRGSEVAMEKCAKGGDPLLPGASKNAIIAAKSADDDDTEEELEQRRLECVKSIYAPVKVDAAGKAKPAVFYVPLITAGKGKELTCKSRFYDPNGKGDGYFNPLKITGDFGEGETSSRGNLDLPLYYLDDSWWGAHGAESPAGMNMKIFLVQADWSEVEGGKGAVVPSQKIYGGGSIAQWTPVSREESEFPSESDEDDDRDEVEEEKPKKKVVPKAVPKAKSKKVVVDDEVDDEVEEEEDDEVVVVKAKPKAAPKAKKIVVVEEDEDEEEPVVIKAKPKAKAVPKAKAKAKKIVVVEEDEDDEVEEEE